MKLNKRNVRAARQNARRDRVCLEFSFVSVSFFQEKEKKKPVSISSIAVAFGLVVLSQH